MTVENGYVLFNTEDIAECFETKEYNKYMNWTNYMLDRINKMNLGDKNLFLNQLDTVSKEILFENKVSIEAIRITYNKPNSHMDRCNRKTGESEYNGFNANTGNGWMTMLMIMAQEVNESLSLFELNKYFKKIDPTLKLVKNNQATHGVSAKAVSIEPDFVFLKNKKDTRIYLELQTLTITSDKEKHPLIFKYSKWKKYQELIKKGCQVYHVVKNIITDTNTVEYEIFNMNKIIKEFGNDYIFIDQYDKRAMGYCYKGKGEKARGYHTVTFLKEQSNKHRTIVVA